MSVWEHEGMVEALKRLHAEGLSTSRIGASLPIPVSRNAVISKLHRMGLVSQHAPKPGNTYRARKPKPAEMKGGWRGLQFGTPPPQVRTEPVHVDPDRDSHIPKSQRVTLLDLEPHHCRWPIGDPQDADFAYCGAHKAQGHHSYCAEHLYRAYDVIAIPTTPIKKRPKPEPVPTFKMYEVENA